MRSLAREESEESPEESDLKKLTSVTDLHVEFEDTEDHLRAVRDATRAWA